MLRATKHILFQTISTFIVWIGLVTNGWSQTYDTIIQKDIYKSYFSFQLEEPVFVSYILYKGGGDCKRTSFKFKNDTKIPMADMEYTGSGYDRGHLVNAEDFAFDCTKDELTFRYYNCLPQTPNLNRGSWKKWETTIRKESQMDSLWILCGGIWENEMEVKEMRIPTQCWKVVYKIKTGEILHVLLFDNLMQNSTWTSLSLPELEGKLNYLLPDRY